MKHSENKFVENVVSASRTLYSQINTEWCEPEKDVLSKRTDFSPKCGDGYLAGNRQDGFGNFEGGTSMVTDKTAKVEHITGHSFFEISFLQWLQSVK